jgi:hypothetical protein
MTTSFIWRALAAGHAGEFPDCVRTFQVELPLRALLRDPSVAELAEQVERSWSGTGLAAPPLVRVSRTSGGLPLSFAQQRLWFIGSWNRDGGLQHPRAVRLSGARRCGAGAKLYGDSAAARSAADAVRDYRGSGGAGDRRGLRQWCCGASTCAANRVEAEARREARGGGATTI